MTTSMSSINFDYLIAEFPEDSAAIQRLATFLEGKRLSKNAYPQVFSVTRMFDVVHPSSMVAFAAILSRLVEKGVLVKIFRIESDALGGIKDYPSLQEVPDTIHDWRRDIDITVTPENIRIYYKMETSQ